MPDRVKIALFELEPWEQGYVRERLQAYDLTFCDGPLTEANAGDFAEADVATVFIRTRVTGELLERLPAIRLVATCSTGFDHVDVEACRRRSVTVCNVPHYGENTVAEHTFGLMLALSRKIITAHARTERGDVSLNGLMGFDLKGKTLGVVGAGNIGLHVIRIARAFDMEVLAYDTQPQPRLAELLGYAYVPLDELLRRSDVVSLHVPYTQETHHLLSRERFALMKPGSLLINTARGGVIDTAALLWALDAGILAGAGLDVIEGEELLSEERQLLDAPAAEEKLRSVLRHHALLRYENVVYTPHMAFYSREALQRILDTTVANVVSFLEGNPQNVVGGR